MSEEVDYEAQYVSLFSTLWLVVSAQGGEVEVSRQQLAEADPRISSGDIELRTWRDHSGTLHIKAGFSDR